MSHYYSNHCRFAWIFFCYNGAEWFQPKIPFLEDQCFGSHFQTGSHRAGIIRIHHPGVACQMEFTRLSVSSRISSRIIPLFQAGRILGSIPHNTELSFHHFHRKPRYQAVFKGQARGQETNKANTFDTIEVQHYLFFLSFTTANHFFGPKQFYWRINDVISH